MGLGLAGTVIRLDLQWLGNSSMSPPTLNLVQWLAQIQVWCMDLKQFRSANPFVWRPAVQTNGMSSGVFETMRETLL